MQDGVTDILISLMPPCRPGERWRPLLEPVPALAAGEGIPLTGAMLAIWRIRPDLQALYPLDHADGRLAFALWCVISGQHEYAVLRDGGAPLIGALARPAAGLDVPGVGPVVSELMRLLHRGRPDLQRLFDLDTDDGRLRYLGWFVQSGRRDLRCKDPLPDWQRALLAAPCPEVPQDGPLPLTRVMMLLHRLRADLQDGFDLTVEAERQRYVRWFHLHGAPDLDLPGVPGAAETALLTLRVLGGDGAAAGEDAAIPLIGYWIWCERGDLQATFPLSEPAGRVAFARWLGEHGVAEYRLTRLFAPAGEPAAGEPATGGPAADGPASAARPARRGLDLVGHAFGELGIGEDVRMAARACAAADLPFGIVNFRPGSEVRQQDATMAAHVTDRFDHHVNLLCMTGFETARAFATYGTRPFEGRYTIGCWPWELPEWPREWRFAFALVDEVWASSRYTQAAFEAVAPVPVVHMPMAVTVERRRPFARADFGLPEDRFLFVFSFDGLSYLARKNPLAVIRAFRLAFPRGTEPVGVVVKAMNVAGRPEWEELRAEAARDPRIHLLAQTLDREAVLGLYAACDAFVSLHRAEGFGRGLAEAMLLDKPVIATAYSGNLEFCRPDTACLVGHRLVPVEAGAYPAAAGQVWAEPDVGQAAAHMAALAADPARARALGHAGRAFVEAHHSPAVVGARYRRRLEALGLLP